MRSRLDSISAGIQKRGIAVADSILDDTVVAALHAEALDAWAAGALCRAAVGTGLEKQRADPVRGDLVRWLDRDRATAAQAPYWSFLDALRALLSTEFRVHLERTELHFAVYPEGAGYARHLDRFRDRSNRIFSTILYLNPGWTADDGGALRIYDGAGHRDLLPEAGRFVCFRSDLVEHEVRPARRPRVSLTGWMRRDAFTV